MKNSIVGIVFLLVLNQVFSQKNIFLDISPMFQSSSLEMNVNYTAWDGKTIKFDHFDDLFGKIFYKKYFLNQIWINVMRFS